jgi:hypothetical protein
MINNKRASIFIFILILINVIMILWYVVFNNVTVMNNNIDIWKNAEEVFKNVQQKGDINIQTDLKYNWNWNGFEDFISCPTNITMSWTSVKLTWLISEMHYELWSYFCLGYNSNDNTKEFRIFFDKTTHNFTRVFYEWDIVDLAKWGSVVKWSNIAKTASVTASSKYASWSDKSNAHDWVVDYKEYISKYDKKRYYKFDFWSEKTLHSMEIFHFVRWYWSMRDTAKVYYYNWSNSLIKTSKITWIRLNSYYLQDFTNLWLTWVRYLEIKENSWNKHYLDFKEIKIYDSTTSWWWANTRQWVRQFNDTDNTLISFDSTWVGWNDNIDDNFNSDDYKVGSTWSILYPGWFQDDDVIPRLTIFWDVRDSKVYQNIFWSNYKTNAFIDKNTNNNDGLNLKMWDITDWNLYLDFFSDSKNIKFDLKLYEFDHNAYKNDNTLLLNKSYEIKDLTMNSWFIQYGWGSLWLSTTRTVNTFPFDFKNKDYALFVINKLPSNLSYRITWESSTWTWLYINPIDDSLTWSIESLSNHMIIWDEKNFIWEQFIIVWNK